MQKKAVFRIETSALKINNMKLLNLSHIETADQISEFHWSEAQARRIGKNGIKPSSAVRNGSSLHKIIKTPEQEKAFMKSLQSA